MIDATKISNVLLEAIISNLGWEDGEDKAPYLAQVEQMRPIDALRRFAAWELGSSEWADIFVRYYEDLKEAQAKEAQA